VYFCVLEALQNAQKHSDAHRVEIRLTQEGDGLTFSVSDDGEGFDFDGARQAGTGWRAWPIASPPRAGPSPSTPSREKEQLSGANCR